MLSYVISFTSYVSLKSLFLHSLNLQQLNLFHESLTAFSNWLGFQHSCFHDAIVRTGVSG